MPTLQKYRFLHMLVLFSLLLAFASAAKTYKKSSFVPIKPGTLNVIQLAGGLIQNDQAVNVAPTSYVYSYGTLPADWIRVSGSTITALPPADTTDSFLIPIHYGDGHGNHAKANITLAVIGTKFVISQEASKQFAVADGDQVSGTEYPDISTYVLTLVLPFLNVSASPTDLSCQVQQKIVNKAQASLDNYNSQNKTYTALILSVEKDLSDFIKSQLTQEISLNKLQVAQQENQTRRSFLQKSISSDNINVNSFQLSLKSLQPKISSLESQIGQLQKNKIQSEVNRTDKLKALTPLLSEIDKLTASQRSQQESLKAKSVLLTDSNSKLEQVLNRQKESTSKIKINSERIAAARKQLQLALAEEAALLNQKKVNDASESLARAAVKLVENDIQTVTDRLTTIKQELQTRQKKYQIQTTEIQSAFNSQIAEIKTKSSKINASLQDAKKQSTQLSQLLNTVKDQLTSETADLATIDRNIKTNEQAIGNTMTDLYYLSIDVQAQKSVLKELEILLARVVQQINRAKKQLGVAVKALGVCNSKPVSLRNQGAVVSSENVPDNSCLNSTKISMGSGAIVAQGIAGKATYYDLGSKNIYSGVCTDFIGFPEVGGFITYEGVEIEGRVYATKIKAA